MLIFVHRANRLLAKNNLAHRDLRIQLVKYLIPELHPGAERHHPKQLPEHLEYLVTNKEYPPIVLHKQPQVFRETSDETAWARLLFPMPW